MLRSSRGAFMTNTAAPIIPAYVPAAIAAEIDRAAKLLTALGVPAERIQRRYAEFAALLDSPHGYSIMFRGTVDEIAPLLVPLYQHGIGFNVVLMPIAAALVVQFHAQTYTIGLPFGNKLRFGVDCDGFWCASPVYAGGVR